MISITIKIEETEERQCSKWFFINAESVKDFESKSMIPISDIILDRLKDYVPQLIKMFYENE